MQKTNKQRTLKHVVQVNQTPTYHGVLETCPLTGERFGPLFFLVRNFHRQVKTILFIYEASFPANLRMVWTIC